MCNTIAWENGCILKRDLYSRYFSSIGTNYHQRFSLSCSFWSKLSRSSILFFVCLHDAAWPRSFRSKKRTRYARRSSCIYALTEKKNTSAQIDSNTFKKTVDETDFWLVNNDHVTSIVHCEWHWCQWRHWVAADAVDRRLWSVEPENILPISHATLVSRNVYRLTRSILHCDDNIQSEYSRRDYYCGTCSMQE